MGHVKEFEFLKIHLQKHYFWVFLKFPLSCGSKTELNKETISAHQNRKLSVTDVLRHLALATVDLWGLVNNNCSPVVVVVGI